MEKLLEEFKETSFELCMLCETMERVSNAAYDDGVQAEDISNALYMPLLMLNELQSRLSVSCDKFRNAIEQGGDAA